MLTESSRFTRPVHRAGGIPAAARMGIAILIGIMTLRGAAGAAVFTVNSTDDATDAKPGDGFCATTAGGNTCTLRAAIQESNALAGADTINIPANTYTLSLGGRSEDGAATGDLDILDDVSLIGSSTGPTIINGNGIDRVFDVSGPATVSMTRLIIQGGIAINESGGGIRSDATLSLSEVAMRNNQACNTPACTSGDDGGAIANFNSGQLQLTNVTLSGNAAADSGGAIANFDQGRVQLTNVTMSFNSAQTGGGIRNLSVVHLVNSIVAKNMPGGNCSGSGVDSQGFNLEDAPSCFFDAPGDLPPQDPLFSGPLIDNGGFTLTLALSTSSPAVDAGNNANCPLTDQRGFARPIDGDGDSVANCDIGAFELQPNFTPTRTLASSATPTLTVPPTSSPTTSSTPTLTATPAPTDTLPPATATPTLTPRGPALVIAMTSGYPGDQVIMSVSLDAEGAAVASAQSDVGFDVVNIPIAALPSGAPDCTVNPALDKQGSFTFISAPGCHGLACACGGGPCTGLRAALYPSLPITALPDGVVLYTCRVNIAVTAVPAEYLLTQTMIVLGDALGNVLPGAGGTAGVIVVLPPPIATATPTGTPSATETGTPTVTNSPTPTATVPPTDTPTPTASSTPSRTATASPSPTKIIPACVGDCDASGDVTINELITMVNIALGEVPVSGCLAGDADHSGEITIDEILRAVNNALGSCG